MDTLLSEYQRYLEASGRFSKYTIRNYLIDVKEFLRFLTVRRISPERVDREIIRDYLAELHRMGRVRASLARKLSALRSFYRYLKQERGWANPMDSVKAPKQERRLPSYLNREEIEKLLAVPDEETPIGLRDRALLELLYAAGLRVSELASLECSQVDLISGEIRVKGKGNKERIALMGRPAIQALREYLERGRPRIPGSSQSPYLFLNYEGKRLSPRSIQKLVREYAVRAGLGKRVHPHLIRHTFATHLLDGDADLRVVQELLGHASLSSTQIYTHVSRSHIRQVYLKAHPRARRSDEDFGD